MCSHMPFATPNDHLQHFKLVQLSGATSSPVVQHCRSLDHGVNMMNAGVQFELRGVSEQRVHTYAVTIITEHNVTGPEASRAS